MPFKAREVKLTQRIENILEKYSKSRTLPANQIERAKIILLASQGRNNQEISEKVSGNQDTVSKWRTRFINQADYFFNVEQNNPDELEETIAKFLKDAPRPGCPCTITEEQIIKILEIACRRPEEFGYETSHFSLPQLAATVVELNIVESISPSSIHRFLKYGKSKAASNSLLASLHRKSRHPGDFC